MGTKLIELNQITKRYDEHTVLKDINLYINKNEFLTLLGPSGCGKTTMLRIIGGFEHPNSGHVLFEQEDITLKPPYQRRVNTVFQRYALFPHLNVFENIAFGLKLKNMSKALIDEKVHKALQLVDLNGYDKRSINKLSGGQQQRVAMARAIVNEPEVLLLDEPLGALDLKLRKEMQYELKRLQRELGITFIFVTHDQEEALTMSDTIVVMNKGIIQQIGTPEDIYNEPANAFVADFIGESNILSGKMLKDCVVELLNIPFECVDKGFKENEAVDVVIRPEDVNIVPAEIGQIVGKVEEVTFKGVHYEIDVIANDFWWLIHSTEAPKVGSEVGLSIIPFNLHIMKKVVEAVES